jgi:hypothetical protein
MKMVELSPIVQQHLNIKLLGKPVRYTLADQTYILLYFYEGKYYCLERDADIIEKLKDELGC